jgi:glycosyltransferase involved in cell wall biosynthesis
MVLPDLFPRFKNDIHGIFILDYIRCVENSYNILVYYNRLSGNEKGYLQEDINGTRLIKSTLFDNNVPNFLRPLLYLFWFLKGYKHCIRFNQIDLIHAHGIILNGTLAYFVARKLKIPFVITVHQGPFSVISENFIFRTWAKIILEKADKVMVVSNHLKNEILTSKIKPRDIEVTYNPVNTGLFCIKPGRIREKKIVFAGRLDNFKGGFRTVKAFSIIAEKLPGWTLTIIGDGEDKKSIEEFISEKPELVNRIFLTGQISKEEIADSFNSSSFFVFPSLHESFGLVIAEAMACGLPVIVGDDTAPPEFVDDNCGLKIDAADINSITQAILQMSQSFNRFNPEEIRNKVVDRFGFESFGQKLDSIYSDLI